MTIITCLTIVLSIDSSTIINANALTGDSSDIIDSKSGIVTYLEDKYSGMDDVTINQKLLYVENYGYFYNLVYEVKLDTTNYSQSTFNTYYENNNPGTDIDGTCTFIASTIMMEYYSRVKNQFDIIGTFDYTYYSTYYYNTFSYDIQNEKDVFSAIYDLSNFHGYVLNSGGTLNIYHDNILEIGFDLFDSENSASNHTNPYSVIKSETYAGRPVLFNVSNHTMVGTGYLEYNVSYTETTGWWIWKTTTSYTVTEGIAIINDGNSSYNIYKYYPADLLPNFSIIYRATKINEN